MIDKRTWFAEFAIFHLGFLALPDIDLDIKHCELCALQEPLTKLHSGCSSDLNRPPTTSNLGGRVCSDVCTNKQEALALNPA